MLRSKNASYVCDVNGFSFVKTSKKYYEDCANQLSKIILRKLQIENHKSSYRLLPELPGPVFPEAAAAIGNQGAGENRPYRPQDLKNRDRWELRSVVAVFRHGDRTPK